MKNKHVLLVGCGNLGSRHLQGLAKITSPLTISVVEPNSESVNTAKSRLSEIPQDRHKISWHKDMSTISEESELVIVSTNSSGRAKLITELLEKGHHRLLVEKIVCQSAYEYDNLLKSVDRHNAKAWVNASKRCYPFYQKLKNSLDDSKVLRLSVNAGNIGLGTNAIHFIDLFLWFSNNNKILLNGDHLCKEILSNKRGKEYVEFVGTITGRYENSDSLLTISFLTEDNLPITVNIMSDKERLLIDETNLRVHNLINKKTSEGEFRVVYQSEITNKIVEDIFRNDDCILPTLSDMSFPHKELFRIFNEHLQKITNQKRELCPIT